MVTKDFLREVLMENKKLMKMKEVKFIHVPKYDELSVKALLPHLQNDKMFMQYFPEKLPKGHFPER